VRLDGRGRLRRRHPLWQAQACRIKQKAFPIGKALFVDQTKERRKNAVLFSLSFLCDHTDGERWLACRDLRLLLRRTLLFDNKPEEREAACYSYYR
jgi:hypothetical protein